MKNEFDVEQSVLWLFEPEVTEFLRHAAGFTCQSAFETVVSALIWKYCLTRIWNWMVRIWRGNQS